MPANKHGVPAGRTTASWNVCYLLSYAVARGLARDELVARFALDPAALEDVDGRVPLTSYVRMWHELPELAGDPDMPLHVLEHAVRSEPPLSALIFLSSATLGDALRRMARYERLTFDLADEPVSELIADGDRAHIVLNHERSALTPPTGAVIDALLGLLTLARMSTKADVVPLEVTLRHPRPQHVEAYLSAFQCPVHFDAARDRMTLRADELRRPHPDASRTLHAIVERYAQNTLSELPTGDFLANVRRAIHARLPDGEVVLADLACALGLSTRTLQRRLEAEGTSLRRLLDRERHVLALQHIQNPRTSLTDIAFLLGFADQSAFTRAFTRWTARSPRAYRRALAEDAQRKSG